MNTQSRAVGLILVGLLWGAAGCSQSSAKMKLAGDRHMEHGNYASATMHYQSAQSKNDSTGISLRLATAMIKTKRYNDALAELNRINHTSPQADYLRAACHLALNDVASGKTCLEKSLKARPNDAMALSLLGRIHYLQQQYAQSAETYQEALAASSDPKVRERILYNLAIAQMQSGQFYAADQTFKKYLSKHAYVSQEDNKMAGAIAYAAGDRQRALNHWQKLSQKERKAILNAIDNDVTAYQVLAVN